jgi:hypothetical protein
MRSSPLGKPPKRVKNVFLQNISGMQRYSFLPGRENQGCGPAVYANGITNFVYFWRRYNFLTGVSKFARKDMNYKVTGLNDPKIDFKNNEVTFYERGRRLL